MDAAILAAPSNGLADKPSAPLMRGTCKALHLEIAGRPEVLTGLPDALKGLPDLERGLMRILHRTSHPAELAGSLQVVFVYKLRT
jgi:hypothetical protein